MKSRFRSLRGNTLIRRTFIVFALVATDAASALGQQQERAPADSVVSQVGFDQKLGIRLPLDLRFRDDSGRELALGELFGKRPVILAPVYYRCPLLCSQVLNGLTRSLKPLSLEAGKDFDVVAFSINPEETPELAAQKKAAYLKRYDRPGTESGWHFLTGDSVVDRGPDACDRLSLHLQPRDQAVRPRRRHHRRDARRPDRPLLLRHRLPAQGAPVRARAGAPGAGSARRSPGCSCSATTTTRRRGKYTLSILRLIRVLGTATVARTGQFPVHHVPSRSSFAVVDVTDDELPGPSSGSMDRTDS